MGRVSIVNLNDTVYKPLNNEVAKVIKVHADKLQYWLSTQEPKINARFPKFSNIYFQEKNLEGQPVYELEPAIKAPSPRFSAFAARRNGFAHPSRSMVTILKSVKQQTDAEMPSTSGASPPSKGQPAKGHA